MLRLNINKKFHLVESDDVYDVLGAVVAQWTAGQHQAINPAPGACILPKFILLAQDFPSPYIAE